jgi:hypothetical protein
MTIQQTTAAIRATRIEMNNTRSTNQIRLARLGDRMWDLTARYNMLLRTAGLDPV